MKRAAGAPIIACHVGADAAADLVAMGGDGASVPRMLVDIGTNTEVILTDGQRTLACSCPAGPAFEGGLIRYQPQTWSTGIVSVPKCSSTAIAFQYSWSNGWRGEISSG